MAIPFLSDIRLPSAGKVYLWTGHNDNFLKYNLWQAYASAGMFIKNIANNGSIIFQTESTTALTLDSSQNATFAGTVTVNGDYLAVGNGDNNNTLIQTRSTSSYYSGIKLTRGAGDWSSTGNNNFGMIVTDNGIELSKFTALGQNVTGRAPYLTIADGGNATFAGSVGIGTTPAASVELHVNGDVRVDSTSGVATRKIRSGYFSSTTDIVVASGASANVRLQNGTTDALVIDSSQNATFAGTVASVGLDVQRNSGSSDDILRITSADIVTTIQRIENTSDANAGYGRLDFKTNAAIGHGNAGRGGFKFINGAGNDILYLDNNDSSATFAGNVDITGTKITMDTIMLQDTAGGRLGFNRDTSNGNIHDSTYNAYQIQNNTGASQGGKLEIQEYNSNGTYAGSTFITGNKLYLNDYVVHNGDENTYYGFETDDTWRVVVGGAEALNINTSRIRTNKHIEPSADSTYNIGTNSVRFSNVYADTLHGTVALSSEASNLGSFDDRDMAPEDMSFSDDLKLFFVEKTGIEGGTVGSNWQDALFISSYVDASGGNPNLLAFDKSEKKIYHYQASATATSWGTPKELAYTDSVLNISGGTLTGDLYLTLSGTTQRALSSTGTNSIQIGDAGVQKLRFKNAAGVSLDIEADGHVSIPNAYIAFQDLNSHAQIEATSSSMFLKAVNIQTQGNLIPDGSGSRSLGASNRYWSETYTNGVTSGGNIVINSNTPVLTLGVINSSTGNSKIQFYSKNSGAANGYALQYNKDTGIDRLEFIDGSGTANIKFNNGGTAEFAGSVTASTINTGQGATEVHLMNQNVRTSDNVQFADLTLTGNLNLYGDINTQNVTNLDVTDKVITVGKGQAENASGGSGLVVDGSGASILWDESNDTWDFNKGINVGGHIELDSARGVVFDNGNNNNAWYIRNGGSNSATLQFGLGASPGSNIKHTFEGNGAVSFATYVSAATGFRMASGQAIDFVSTNIGYNSIERNTSVGGLQINTGDTNSMNILDNGNVGLNTTSPEEKLTISTGNVQFRKTTQAANTSLGFLGWKNTYATGTHVAAKIDVLTRNESSNAHDYTNLVFYTWNGYNSLSEKMRIADDGNVGIGYDNPYKKLHLHNPTDSGTPDCQMNFTTGVTEAGDGNGFRVGWNGTVANMYLFENADMRFATNNSERMRISAAGNVGIGETNPSHKITAPSGTNGRVARLGNLEITTQSGTYTGSSIEVTGSNSFITYRSTLGHKFVTRTSGGGNTLEAMTIVPDTGRVGIGTSSPSSPLHIAGTSGSVAGSAILFNGNTAIWQPSDASLTIRPSGNDAATFTSSGTTFAGKIIAEKGVNYTGGTIATATTVLHTNSIVYNIGGSNGIILSNADYSDRYYITNADHRWEVASSDAMRLNSTGLGIGTTTPQVKLDVDLGGNNGMNASFAGTIAAGEYQGIHFGYSENANSNYRKSGLVFERQDGSARGKIHILNNAQAGSNSAALADSRVTIQYDGNVGVATTAPTYKLSVSGGIQAGGKITYSKSYASINATGNAVAGITAGSNGSSCGFTFTCFGHTGKYQRIVYSCYNDAGTWRPKKVIDEGTNDLDVTASADGSTITFTFKATSSNMNYTPRVTVEATGHNINSTYA